MNKWRSSTGKALAAVVCLSILAACQNTPRPMSHRDIDDACLRVIKYDTWMDRDIGLRACRKAIQRDQAPTARKAPKLNDSKAGFA